MTIKNNLKATVLNLLGAASSVTVAASEIVLESSSLVAGTASGFIPTAKELVRSPVSAFEGYIMEDRNISLAEAEAVTSAFGAQSVAELVRLGSRESGKAVSLLLQGWDDLEEEVTTKAIK